MKSFKQFIMEMDETINNLKQPTKVGPNNAFPMDKGTQYNLNRAAKTIGVKFKLEPVNIK